jgi:NADH:ubiquinone oxidoreductase subunit 4 (subunit M)
MFLGHMFPALTTVCLLLFVGAMGKSAQLGLHTWLPDAMEGPTPVSALIHAAAMVTAGVFMVARLSPIFEYAPTALMVVTIVGALTCFIAGSIGLTQFDIKRVIAYSTMSQLGYMCLRRFGLFGGDFPSHDACVFQGVAIPRRGVGYSRDVGRAGHAQDGRYLAQDSNHLCTDVDRLFGAGGDRA